MIDARPSDQDPDGDSASRCALLDEYWEGLKRFSNSDPKSWLGDQPIEHSGMVDDLEVLNLWNQVNQAASASGTKFTARSTIFPPGQSRVSDGLTESDDEEIENPRQIGKYLVVAKLGEGGQARVFRVYHPELGQERVVKLLKRTSTTDPDGVRPAEA